jgi:hypothetical protein
VWTSGVVASSDIINNGKLIGKKVLAGLLPVPVPSASVRVSE